MPSTNWQERIDPGETERFQRYAQRIRSLQKRGDRGLHAKGQIALRAQFTVLPDLPEHARPAFFAEPKTFGAVVRFSNGSGKRQHDKKPDVRGVALKLFGVTGEKIFGDARTQDFLLIRSSKVPFRNADEFVPIAMAAASPLNLPKAISALGFRRTFAILKTALGDLKLPVKPLAATDYFSAAPIQFGRYAVRYALKARATEVRPRLAGADHLAAELAGSLPVEYDFQVQFFEDEAATPIEDASIDWNTPYVTLARLTIPKQDGDLTAWADRLSFDPWHAVKELKPLGNVMRARGVAYRVSTQERNAAPEPGGLP